VEGLAERSAALGTTELARSHGDFQPGNVLIDVDAGRVLLTDWEHTGVRFRWYDPLVWGLRSRFAGGLEGRVARFLSTGDLWGGAGQLLPREASDRPWRESALALFLLEELAWIAEDSLSGPRLALSPPAVATLALVEGLGRFRRG
jgi:hypothetical protein